MTDEFAQMPETKTWSRMSEYRLVGSIVGAKKLGPILQQAWRCRENGEIKWETVPTVYLSPADFLAAQEETKT